MTSLSAHARVRRAQMWAHRWILQRDCSRLEAGTATIGIAFYRTPRHLEIQLDRVLRHSDRSVLRQVRVVDNSAEEHIAAGYASNVILIDEMPANVGHGAALDWAAWHTETEFFIALDSDAWPIADNWLDILLTPLRQGAAISGIRHERDFIHPSCLAIRTATLRKHRLSFVHRYPDFPMRHEDPNNGRLYWDVGERISWVLKQRGERLHRIIADPSESDTYVGSTYGGVVYHQWYGTRLEVEPDRTEFDGIPRAVIEHEMERWLRGFSGREEK